MDARDAYACNRLDEVVRRPLLPGNDHHGDRLKRNGRVLAVASIFHDVENLKAELAMERAVASDDWSRWRGDLWRAARLLVIRGQEHAASQRDLKTVRP